MLKVKDLTVAYSAAPVLHGVSLEVAEGKIVAMLGANGAGKSTILKTISGLVKPVSGEIEFCGKIITGMRPDEIVKLGLAHVPEGRLVFPGLTVAENLKIGAYVCRYSSAKLKEKMDKIYELFPRLAERYKQLAGTLSGGEQQMLAIGRALMSEPKLLMLDEPSLGLAPVIVELIMNKIKEINQLVGTTILLIEQNAELALSIADYAYVLSVGKVVLSGSCDELSQNKFMVEAYLGGEKS